MYLLIIIIIIVIVIYQLCTEMRPKSRSSGFILFINVFETHTNISKLQHKHKHKQTKNQINKQTNTHIYIYTRLDKQISLQVFLYFLHHRCLALLRCACVCIYVDLYKTKNSFEVKIFCSFCVFFRFGCLFGMLRSHKETLWAELVKCFRNKYWSTKCGWENLFQSTGNCQITGNRTRNPYFFRLIVISDLFKFHCYWILQCSWFGDHTLS